MQQRKFVKVQDSHPHNQRIRGATVVLNLYIIMYQSSINVTPTLLSLRYEGVSKSFEPQAFSPFR